MHPRNPSTHLLSILLALVAGFLVSPSSAHAQAPCASDLTDDGVVWEAICYQLPQFLLRGAVGQRDRRAIALDFQPQVGRPVPSERYFPPFAWVEWDSTFLR